MTDQSRQAGRNRQAGRDQARPQVRPARSWFRQYRRSLLAIFLLAVWAWCLAPTVPPRSPASGRTITVGPTTASPGTASPGTASPGTASPEPRTPAVAARDIESIRVGSRVLAENPEIAPAARAARRPPDWRDWIWLSLELPLLDAAPDHSERASRGPAPADDVPPIVHVELIRPEGWVLDQLWLATIDRVVPPRIDHDRDLPHAPDADREVPSLGPLRPIYVESRVAIEFASATGQRRLGFVIDLDLPEMGVAGPAWVTDLRPCPQIRPGAGEVVTGTFRHPPAGQVLDVWFEGEPRAIGVTANHPFWNVEGGIFMPIGEMSPGQRVRTLAGQTKRLVRMLPRPGPQVVYNLEVYGEHVYHVGRQGILAHNSYATGGGGVSELQTLGHRSRVFFRGLEVRAVRSLSHLDEATLKAISRFGFAPKDQAGNKLVLHHLNQNPLGPLVEMPARRHSIANRIQHPHGNASGAGLQKTERESFNVWREDYWKTRATAELQRRGDSP